MSDRLPQQKPPFAKLRKLRRQLQKLEFLEKRNTSTGGGLLDSLVGLSDGEVLRQKKKAKVLRRNNRRRIERLKLKIDQLASSKSLPTTKPKPSLESEATPLSESEETLRSVLRRVELIERRRRARRLRPYHRALQKHNTVFFSCPLCREDVSCLLFESHCSLRHRVQPKVSCVWCLGEYRWTPSQKHQQTFHLLRCFRRFLERCPAIEIPRPPVARKNPSLPRLLLPAGAFDPVWPLPLDPSLLTYQDDALQLAAACVRKYLELGTSVEWFHVTVPVATYPCFLEKMTEAAGRIRTLPFSCWCDPGPDGPHRHFLIVSQASDSFRDAFWNALQPIPCPTCRETQPVVSALHLVQLLGYVSRRKSRCHFGANRKKKQSNRFHVSHALPCHYEMALVTLWHGGLKQWLPDLYSHMPAERWKDWRNRFFFSNEKWRVRIRDLPHFQKRIVFPVSADLEPCSHPTDCFLHLVNGRRLYFERNPDPPADVELETSLPREEVLRNAFYQVVQNVTWTPGDFLQKRLDGLFSRKSGKRNV